MDPIELECAGENQAELDLKIEWKSLSVVVWRVVTPSNLPKPLHGLAAAVSETLSEEQQQQFIQLLLTYQSLFAKTPTQVTWSQNTIII